MVKLTDRQQKLITRVAETKALLEPELDKLKRKHALEIYDLEAPLRIAVQAAYASGAPLRQIGEKGLGTKDYRTQRMYLPDPEEVETDEPDYDPTPLKAAVVPLENNLFKVVDGLKREWYFWTINFDGLISVERNSDKRGAATYTLPITPEVLEAVKEGYPTADISELEED